MIQSALIILIPSYVAYRLAIMLSYFLSYGNVLDFIKLYFAKKVDIEQMEAVLETIIGKPLTENANFFESQGGVFDHLQAKSKWFTLINCPYCLSVWISVPIAIFIFFKVGFIAFLIPLIAFHLIDLG